MKNNIAGVIIRGIKTQLRLLHLGLDSAEHRWLVIHFNQNALARKRRLRLVEYLEPAGPMEQECFKYGFNGKESDDEAGYGDDGFQDYGMRVYMPGLGRFLSVDPIADDYPWYTPYQFAGNMPIWAIDLDGLEPAFKGSKDGQYEVAQLNGSDRFEDKYGWTWNAKDEIWQQGTQLFYHKGNALLNSDDDDLSKTYYADQSVNSICSLIDDSEDCHSLNFEASFLTGLMLENEDATREAAALYQSFVNGSRGTHDFLSYPEVSGVSEFLREDAGFKSVADKFEKNALDYYKEHGTLEGFEGKKYLAKPYVSGTFYMHTIMGGTQQVDAVIQHVSSTDITVLYRVWDHFGAGRKDASSKLPGLPSMYWLQHNSPNPEKYKPFIWNV